MATIPILSKLIDAQQMHREYPDSFEVPSAHTLALIKPGDYVKVCREDERFWCKVLGGSGRYLIEEVENELVMPANAHINVGQRVRFEHRHIYVVMTPPTQH